MARPKRKKNPVLHIRKSAWEHEEARLALAAARMHSPISLLVLLDKFGFSDDDLRLYLSTYADYLHKAIRDQRWLADITTALEDEYNIDLRFKEI